MKYIKYASIIVVCILSITACRNNNAYQAPPTTESLFNDYKKSVVLIYNRYYYELPLSDTASIYFTSLDGFDESSIYRNKEDAIKNASNNMGTGFFISTDGKVATNLHVIQPTLSEQNIASFDYFVESLKDSIENAFAVISENISSIDASLTLNSWNLSASEIEHLKSSRASLASQYKNFESFQKLKERLSIDNLQFKTAFVGIAYENANIEQESIESNEAMLNFTKNFAACEALKKSANNKYDLAIIQLKDKTTPSFVSKVFNFDDNNPNLALESDTITKFDIYNPATINKNVMMIGYNYGLELAKTASGIKPQLTQGKISQESDGVKVLYSIPALPGSSGSPIIDEWGNLIAVNYAGMLNTQSFNYGILSKHLMELDQGKLSNDKLIKADKDFFKTKNKTVQGEEASASVEQNLEALIAKDPNIADQLYMVDFFLDLENKRDINSLLACLADPMQQYSDLKQPSKTTIKSRYENTWSNLVWSKNKVRDVTYISKNKYKANIEFSYESTKGTSKTVNSTLIFEFNANNKIILINKL